MTTASWLKTHRAGVPAALRCGGKSIATTYSKARPCGITWGLKEKDGKLWCWAHIKEA